MVIGHNRDIAWGMTNLDPDVSDLYLEKVTGKTYLYGGKQVPLSEHDEVIRIAGGGSKLITVRSTRHGPLLSDVSAELSSVGANAKVPADSPDRGNGYAVALAWTALTPRPTADALFGFDAATNWSEFREAARSFAVPSQNLVYADTAGNIGYQAPGAIPIRKGNRDGNYPAAGWLPQNDWSGRYVPFDSLPNVLNPAEGFIVTANQAVTGPDYRWHLTDSFDQGYRSQRIRDLLTAAIKDGKRLDVSDMAKMQLDTRNPMAPVLVPYLMRQLMTSEYYAEGQRLLLDWDYTQPADSAAAAYFNAVWSNLLRLTFHDQLPESQWPDGGHRWIAVVSNLLRQPDSQWWDDATTESVVEDRDLILVRGDARRPRRADPPDLGEPDEVDLGPPAPAPTWRTSRWGRAASGWCAPCSTAGRTTWAAAARSSTPPAGTPRSGTTSTPRPRCGWSSTSTTSNGRAGSTSPASRATSRPATTATRPRCGSTARPWPGRSGATRSTRTTDDRLVLEPSEDG